MILPYQSPYKGLNKTVYKINFFYSVTYKVTYCLWCKFRNICLDYTDYLRIMPISCRDYAINWDDHTD